MILAAPAAAVVIRNYIFDPLGILRLPKNSELFGTPQNPTFTIVNLGSADYVSSWAEARDKLKVHNTLKFC